MNYFPNNTPDHFQTKLAYPITLSGEWECCLTEITIPGKYFTIHPDYNDYYSIETVEDIESTTLLPEINIPLYNKDYSDFVEGVNANIKKLLNNPPVLFSVIQNKIKIKLNPYWEMTITAEKGNNFLRLLQLDPNKDDVTPGFSEGASITRNYSAPNVEIFKNQEFTIALKKPIVKKTHEIIVRDMEDRDIFDQITEKIIHKTGDVLAFFKTHKNKVIITLKSNVELIMNRNSCSKLMDALNIKNESYIIHNENFPVRFDYSELADKALNEKFQLIEYETFSVIHKVQKSYRLKIRSGMYQQSADFFKEFKYILLRELVDSKVEMNVPANTKVTFGEKLSNMLGFQMNTFTEGNYKSDYILELRAGITEVYVYCNIISSSLVGDVSAPILKIIPIANEYKEQIVKQFTVPLYFPVKKHHFDVIEIELVTSSGTPIKFLSGKTNIVLSFRRKIV
ncbi:uncharacterized protein TNCV_3296761 [Trichonephila clavipes]|uniref:Uncharacterized protein n=2 Tax=Trichonephila clavipes TaxID=2585209 RepID=A0A8X6T5N1_TRICX|nr:uncharacterized protein TNCV_3296761 [Trichonephila clavipes]